MPILKTFLDRHDRITAWRHHLHRHPEIGLETHETAAFIAEKLREFGCDEVATSVGTSGVVATIHGRLGNRGRTMGLRADMDALPIHETTGLPYDSVVDGAMHACGHDGHSAMLLGAAEHLCETRNFAGTVVLVFQPAEEIGLGGKAMCDDGLFSRWQIDEIYGLHNAPNTPLGQFATRSGLFFAAVDQFEITIDGSGGHAARPQRAIDPIVIAGQMIGALQTVVSRNVGPMDNAVVSVTSLQSSSQTFNVIPQSVHMRGTVRTHDPKIRDMIRQRIESIVSGTAALMGGTASLSFDAIFPVLVSTPEQTDFATSVAKDVSGEVAQAEMLLGGEDFAFFLQQKPGAFMLLGSGPQITPHNPGYDFNDAIIPFGCSWWVELVERRLAPEAGSR